MRDLTEPQLRALREIQARRVRWAPGARRYWSTEWPPAVRHDVVARVVDARYATLGSRPRRTETSHAVVLTRRGHDALDRADASARGRRMSGS